MKSYVAVQVGARRSYAVPSILEDAGLLEAFYTDLCGSVGWGRLISGLFPGSLRPGPIKNLAGRRLPLNLQGKTQTFFGPTLRYYLRTLLSNQDIVGEGKLWQEFEDGLARKMIRLGVGKATHVFSMSGECMPFIKFAKEKHLVIITEFFIIPTALDIIRAEREAFPELESQLSSETVEAFHSWQKQTCNLADWAIVPSERVRQAFIQNYKMDSSRCFLVPYAVHPSWLDLRNRPVRGRVLFVGSAGLRKGIHYLGMASQMLSHKNYEFRVAGSVSNAVRNHSLTQGLSFLGQVPRSEIKAEFQNADVFVLPSLAEGSAEVTYEALATGLPVITTEAAGSVIRSGIEGFIVPERNAQALAERIEELVENRNLRSRMAVAAKECAKDYTWDKYAQRLLNVFTNI
jgi:glycosyltransferase involved in cell wall biosynthesis